MVRCGDHSDYGTITFLFQDSMGGLELKCKETGSWVAATPVPGTIVVSAALLFFFISGLISG